MENTYSTDDDDEGGAGSAKLIPEWSVGADDQVILAGLAVVAALALLLGWNAWRGGDDDLPIPEAAAEVVDDVAAVAPGTPTSAPAVVVADPTPTTEAAQETTTTTAEPTTTTAAAPIIGDVQAAVDPFPGAITGVADGTTAVLTGFVANDAESREAETAAAAVEGITAVDNQLVILEPQVVTALRDAGVTGATAVGQGTSISVSGTIDTEDDRGPTLAAAEAVEGVTEVIDDTLNVSVTADLNALPQVQFATSSATILEASFADLDAAAALLDGVEGVTIEVQGYTDIQGPEDANLTLSQNRAEAVRDYLVNAGVDPDTLTATGFGETEQFGEDLASNRLVRFQQLDG